MTMARIPRASPCYYRPKSFYTDGDPLRWHSNSTRATRSSSGACVDTSNPDDGPTPSCPRGWNCVGGPAPPVRYPRGNFIEMGD